jgi:hypothetical protein
MARLRADLTSIYAGPENAGKPALLPPGLDWKAIGHSANEAELPAEPGASSLLLQTKAVGKTTQSAGASMSRGTPPCGTALGRGIAGNAPA